LNRQNLSGMFNKSFAPSELVFDLSTLATNIAGRCRWRFSAFNWSFKIAPEEQNICRKMETKELPSAKNIVWKMMSLRTKKSLMKF